jgi:hypothetical protein
MVRLGRYDRPLTARNAPPSGFEPHSRPICGHGPAGGRVRFAVRPVSLNAVVEGRESAYSSVARW